MRDTVYLVSDQWGVRRMTKRAPDLARDEIAIKVTVSIPDSSYKGSTMSAAIEAPEDRIIQPAVTVVVDPVDNVEA